MSTTPHPLAIEAAEECQKWKDNPNSIGLSRGGSVEIFSKLIHTTVLQPVIEAGDELENLILLLDKESDHPFGNEILQALTTWRTLTSPKTGDSTPLEASRSDSEGQKDSGQRKEGV